MYLASGPIAQQVVDRCSSAIHGDLLYMHTGYQDMTLIVVFLNTWMEFLNLYLHEGKP